jgi:hypothetical protein
MTTPSNVIAFGGRRPKKSSPSAKYEYRLLFRLNTPMPLMDTGKEEEGEVVATENAIYHVVPAHGRPGEESYMLSQYVLDRNKTYETIGKDYAFVQLIFLRAMYNFERGVIEEFRNPGRQVLPESQELLAFSADGFRHLLRHTPEPLLRLWQAAVIHGPDRSELSGVEACLQLAEVIRALSETLPKEASVPVEFSPNG